MKKYGLVILAAGGSSRLGSPKQLLNFNHQSLLKNIVSIAGRLSEVIGVVVIGAQHQKMLGELNNSNLSIVINTDWALGMASSIKIGLLNIIAINPLLEACIFVVCDQPYINLPLLQSLINTYEESQKGIVACVYGQTTGTPVLLNKKYFDKLMLLQKEEGAKKLIKEYSNDLTEIPFLNGEIDIDTNEDYKKLLDAFR